MCPVTGTGAPFKMYESRGCGPYYTRFAAVAASLTIPGAEHEIYEQLDDDRTLDQIDDFFFSFHFLFLVNLFASHPFSFHMGQAWIIMSAEIFGSHIFEINLHGQHHLFSAGLAEKASKGQKFRIPEQHGYSY